MLVLHTRCLVRAIYTCLRLELQLSRKTLEQVLASVERQAVKARADQRSASAAFAEAAHVFRYIAGIYRRLNRKNPCLLAALGAFPLAPAGSRMHIGVLDPKTSAWQAHAWLVTPQGTLSTSADLERYTIILSLPRGARASAPDSLLDKPTRAHEIPRNAPQL